MSEPLLNQVFDVAVAMSETVAMLSEQVTALYVAVQSQAKTLQIIATDVVALQQAVKALPSNGGGTAVEPAETRASFLELEADIASVQQAIAALPAATEPAAVVASFGQVEKTLALIVAALARLTPPDIITLDLAMATSTKQSAPSASGP